MSLTRKTGSGLRGGPPGIELASSLFTAQPNEEAAVVDVYKVSSPSVFSSISESLASGDLFSSLGNLLSGIKGGLSGLIKNAQGGLGAIKQGLDTAKNVKSQLDRASDVFKGKSSASLGGLLDTIDSFTGGAIGSTLGPAANLIRDAGKVNPGGKLNPMAIVNSLTPELGADLRDIQNQVGGLQRSFDRVRSAVGKGDLGSVVGSLSGALSQMDRVVSHLPEGNQKDFNRGFLGVVSQVGQQHHKEEMARVIDRSLKDVMDDWRAGDIKDVSLAGAVAGLGGMASEVGKIDIFSNARSQGMNDGAAFIAGGALTNYAAANGHLDILKDLVSDPVGIRSMATNPNALRASVESMTKFTTESFDTALQVAQASGQSFIDTFRGVSKILDASSITSVGGFEMLLAKVEQTKEPQELSDEMALLAASAVMQSKSIKEAFA